ncbi:MAG: hypothetical protein AB7U63_12390 [Porticoccaceae bacterium]
MANTLCDIVASSIDPALKLLPQRMDSEPARVTLLAIGLQESRFLHRRQIGGPARGLWQFERGGGVVGVLRHASSREYAKAVCAARGVDAEPYAVYEQLEHDDVLAAAFARLLLWTDPKSLPAVGKSADAWDLYIRTWQPGKPHPETWPEMYARAEAVANELV